MKVKVDINSRQLVNKIEQGTDRAIIELTPKILSYAKSNHRYNDVTGNLTNSTIIQQVEQGLKLTSTSLYGVYIHEGFNTWTPDDWLQSAMDDNMKLILDTMNKHIERTLK